MKQIENKTLLMKWVEVQKGVKLEELLHDLYIEKELSIREIAEKLGVHYHTVNSWLKLMEIEARLPHEKLLELVEIKRKLKNTEKKEKTTNV